MELLLTVTVLTWTPLIPLRLTIQAGINLWRKMGDLSYLLFFIYWSLVDILLLYVKESWMLPRFQGFLGDRLLGWVLIILSLLFGYWTCRTLGLVRLSTRPQVAPDKAATTLIVTGPYQWIRHPFYFMEWFLLLGLTLVTGSWVVLALAIVSMAVDPLVARFEEKELVQRFGNDYLEYQKRVPRLLPTLTGIFSKG